MAQKNATESNIPPKVEMVVEEKELIIKPVDVEEPRPKSRKSIRPEITLENLIDCPVENQDKKYNLRTRRSDLINWDSPSKRRSIAAKSIFTLPNSNSTIVEGKLILLLVNIE